MSLKDESKKDEARKSLLNFSSLYLPKTTGDKPRKDVEKRNQRIVYQYADELGKKLSDLQSSPHYTPYFLDEEFALLIRAITSFDLEREQEDDRKTASKVPSITTPSSSANQYENEKAIKWKDLMVLSDERKDARQNRRASTPNAHGADKDAANTSPVSSPRQPNSPIHSPRKSPRKSKGVADWMNVKDML